MEQREAVRQFPLEPYVPRVLAEWDYDAPDTRWQRVDGSLCFVDISGFTKLSESLARKGRIGSEELTEVLNRVFGAMLSLAYQRGGSLLKFGGDALLLMFEGDEHAVQATCAAVEMRSELRNAVQIPTSVGRIELKMSVGVHTGPIDLFRVGESHHEVIITGDTATETTALEVAADPGEIVISQALRDRLPSDSADTVKGPGWLLRWRVPRADPVGPVFRRSLAEGDYNKCVPTELRLHLSVGETEPEHRVATVGFVKFKGIADEMAEGGIERVASGLDTLVRTVQAAVDAESVTFLASDIDDDGGKIILTSGVPATREDDDGRMLRALRSIADSDQTFHLKIGVNRGHVFAGEIGNELRRTFTVMGDTVNLAARLMAAAPPGSVYAAPGVLDRSRTLFDTTALEPFLVKGKSEPVSAYAVGPITGIRRSHNHRVLPFVGRIPERSRLIAAFESIGADGGSAMSIFGEAGIGKSRLVEEFLVGKDVSVFSIRAEPNSIDNPLWAFRDPLRELLGIERQSQAQMARELESFMEDHHPELISETPLLASIAQIEFEDNAETAAIDPRFRPERAADALVRLLERTLSAPAVIVAEDAHWADDASMALIDRLAAAATSRQWLVLMTSRPDSHRTIGERLDVGRLNADESREVAVRATEGAPLRPFELDAVVSRGDGNPLFLGEIIQLVRQTGSVADLPESLDALVGAEIDALPPLARRLLRVSSVLGRSFRAVVLEGLVGEDGLALDAANRRELSRFIEVDGPRFRFRHAAVHQAAYEGLSFRRRRELHARAGETIEQLAQGDTDSVAAFLAMHYAAARHHEKAWMFAVVAGDRARKRYANVEAAAQYRVAVEAARSIDGLDPSEVARMYESLGDTCEMASLFDDADNAFQQARRLLADDVRAVGRLMAKQGLIREKAGKLTSALGWLGRGLKAVAEDPSAGESRAALSLAYGGIRFRQGKYDEAIRWCEQVLNTPGATDDQRAHSLYLLVTLYAHTGSPEAMEAGRRAISIYERSDNLVGMGNVLNNMGVDAYYRGDWTAALDFYLRSGDARRRAGDVIGAAASVNNVAEIYSDQGKLELAVEGFRESLYVWESSRFSVGIALASINLGRVFTRRGDHQEAPKALERGLEIFSAMGARSYVFETRLRVAEANIAAGRMADAIAVARSVLEEVPSDSSTLMIRSGIHRVLGRFAINSGQMDEARDRFRTALALGEQADALFEQVLSLQGLAELDGADDYDERVQSAVDRLDLVALPQFVPATSR